MGIGEERGGRVGEERGGRLGMGSAARAPRCGSLRGGSAGLGDFCSIRGGGRVGRVGRVGLSEGDICGFTSSNSSYMSSSISSPAASSSYNA